MPRDISEGSPEDHAHEPRSPVKSAENGTAGHLPSREDSTVNPSSRLDESIHMAHTSYQQPLPIHAFLLYEDKLTRLEAEKSALQQELLELKNTTAAEIAEMQQTITKLRKGTEIFREIAGKHIQDMRQALEIVQDEKESMAKSRSAAFLEMYQREDYNRQLQADLESCWQSNQNERGTLCRTIIELKHRLAEQKSSLGLVSDIDTTDVNQSTHSISQD